MYNFDFIPQAQHFVWAERCLRRLWQPFYSVIIQLHSNKIFCRLSWVDVISVNQSTFCVKVYLPLSSHKYMKNGFVVVSLLAFSLSNHFCRLKKNENCVSVNTRRLIKKIITNVLDNF